MATVVSKEIPVSIQVSLGGSYTVQAGQYVKVTATAQSGETFVISGQNIMQPPAGTTQQGRFVLPAGTVFSGARWCAEIYNIDS